MPRVSEQHLAARREQILAAAMICFSRNGFHATTMADVISESGLSAGAVYRYFTGKNELVAAIAEMAVGTAGDALAELLAAEQAPGPAEALSRLIHAMSEWATDGELDLRRVALQAWAEALRSDQVAAIVKTAQLRIRGHLEAVAARAVEDGRLPAHADPSLVAQALQSLLLGFVLQHLLVGDLTPKDYLRGVTALLADRPVPTD